MTPARCKGSIMLLILSAMRSSDPVSVEPIPFLIAMGILVLLAIWVWVDF